MSSQLWMHSETGDEASNAERNARIKLPGVATVDLGAEVLGCAERLHCPKVEER